MEEVLYDGNTFLGLLITLAGWNCTFIEFTIVPFIWLLIYLFCLFIIKKAISTSGEDQIYRQFLVKYLIYPIIINFSLTILYNCRAFMKSEGLLDCYYYWREGSLFHIISYWGVSLITVIFFIAKEGKI